MNQTQIIVTPAQLAKWAAAADAAGDATSYAGAMLAQGNTLAAKDHVAKARYGIRDLHAALVTAGAQALPPSPDTGHLPLPTFPTADDRKLLDLLAQAQEIAERIDARNGHVLPAHIPLQPGESRGTDIAESVSNLREQLRAHVEGARGRD
jgi:hypothetical protein